MPALENSRQEAFVQALIKGASQTDAYIAAGYKSKTPEAAAANAARLITNDKVASRLKELRAKVEERVIVDRAWVLNRLVENANRAMQSSPVLDREGKETGEYRYEGSVANRALELVGKEFGMFVDRKEFGAPGEFSLLDDAGLDAYIEREAAALMAAEPPTRKRH